jgi:hypothetical protein
LRRLSLPFLRQQCFGPSDARFHRCWRPSPWASEGPFSSCLKRTARGPGSLTREICAVLHGAKAGSLSKQRREGVLFPNEGLRSSREIWAGASLVGRGQNEGRSSTFPAGPRSIVKPLCQERGSGEARCAAALVHAALHDGRALELRASVAQAWGISPGGAGSTVLRPSGTIGLLEALMGLKGCLSPCGS